MNNISIKMIVKIRLLKGDIMIISEKKNIELTNKWDNRLNTDDKILHQLEVLQRIVNKRKKESPNFIDVIKCNGYIVSKILQMQGIDFQFNCTKHEGCWYIPKDSTDKLIKVMFKDNEGNRIYFDINTQK